MKNIFSLLCFGALLCCSASVAMAQPSAWQTVTTTSQVFRNSSGTDAMVTAPNGDVYTLGSLSGTVSFGNISISSTDGDMYVAKWSSASRSFVWVQQAMGGFQFGKTLVMSGNSLYVAGTFMGSSCIFGSNSLTNAGARDAFVAKLTDAGTSASWTWARQVGGASDDYGRALTVQGNNIYVGGSYYSSPASFGALSLTSSGTNNLDGFVTKLVDAGTSADFVWAQRVGGLGTEEVRALAVNGPTVYLAGNYAGPAFALGAASLPARTSADIFVAKLTDAGAAGAIEWAQPAGSANYDEPTALAVRGTSVYVTGAFQGPVATFGTTSLTPASANTDVFVAKLTDAGSSGSFTWALRAGGSSPDVPNGLAVSGSSLYIAGVYSTSADFGSTTLTGAGGGDVFVAKVEDAGNAANWAWAKTGGGANNDGASAVAVAGNTVYVAGFVVPVSNFDSQTVLTPTSSPGILSPTIVAFLATLTDPTLTATEAPWMAASFGIFPNPAHGRATVLLPPGPGVATLTVHDALGRIVRTQPVAMGSNIQLNLTGLAPGLYAVRVQAGGAASTQRLLVE
ncbi:T9SS type A sorting domain-containing protein [Hymenobacter properus]|uniref:T9SS type A sorting domain-containing protein n=1 Tax=Hymenobacter properus TaxID=2791026 RepID=A0A931FJC3_9BACT|nr:T9SS type A sorting domain-containing protein [Hymenobacter properus]MBF9141733.1 T9SS type A sorting domain-containing protein [Hymenobacter properus]MBR7720542.1 T9SS type A sorting domain-containing protein [Microvirga sp. SRT04]